ncbi:MAG: hypothetical protein IJZ91_03680 [Oscillospiraceae bacterium]|nr:hypothetical protein [Oscillospiraceae bacterium]
MSQEELLRLLFRLKIHKMEAGGSYEKISVFDFGGGAVCIGLPVLSAAAGEDAAALVGG